jgi:hypothetical protein
MPAQPHHVPVLQVRAIGQPDHVQAVLDAATQAAERVLGPHITCRTQTRSAGRIGYVRAYLTVTRKENL